jgi:hypothetical protein
MIRKSIRDYADAIRGRYHKASRSEKAAVLEEFCRTTGYHRKSAIRLLKYAPQPAKKRRGRPRKYGLEVNQALRVAWEATDCICSKRLAPFLPELVAVLERHHELVLGKETRALLLQVSAATIDRLLAPVRRSKTQRPYTSTHASAELKAKIAIRTFADWKDAKAGYVEIDLVAHCGESTEGFYLNTLVAVDVATGWTECVPVWGKSQNKVGGAVDQAWRQLPFALLGIDSDNGGEFINQVLWDYSERHKIVFTRSRPYKKNDQAYVEQKNWTAIRQRVGYDRYATRAAYDQLARLYEVAHLHINFFQPIRKIVGKERVGAKTRKAYDRAQTPYQRLLAAGVLDENARAKLVALYETLNPVALRKQMDESLEALWKLSAPSPLNKAAADAQARMDAIPD